MAIAENFASHSALVFSKQGSVVCKRIERTRSYFERRRAARSGSSTSNRSSLALSPMSASFTTLWSFVGELAGAVGTVSLERLGESRSLSFSLLPCQEPLLESLQERHSAVLSTHRFASSKVIRKPPAVANLSRGSPDGGTTEQGTTSGSP
jgi:hypothetical protein